MLLIRSFNPHDLAELVAYNNAEVPHVGSLDHEAATSLVALAHAVLVAEQNGTLVGFVVVFEPGSSYQSPNYRWFDAALDGFVYVDRIVVVPSAKGSGVGGALYDEVAELAHPRSIPVTCEVNIVPPNEPSMSFHLHKGFVEIGQLGDEHKRVAMLAWDPSVA